MVTDTLNVRKWIIKPAQTKAISSDANKIYESAGCAFKDINYIAVSNLPAFQKYRDLYYQEQLRELLSQFGVTPQLFFKVHSEFSTLNLNYIFRNDPEELAYVSAQIPKGWVPLYLFTCVQLYSTPQSLQANLEAFSDAHIGMIIESMNAFQPELEILLDSLNSGVQRISDSVKNHIPMLNNKTKDLEIQFKANKFKNFDAFKASVEKIVGKHAAVKCDVDGNEIYLFSPANPMEALKLSQELTPKAIVLCNEPEQKITKDILEELAENYFSDPYYYRD